MCLLSSRQSNLVWWLAQILSGDDDEDDDDDDDDDDVEGVQRDKALTQKTVRAIQQLASEKR